MKRAVVVDMNRCEGYAQCVFAAPAVFQLHGEEALRYDPNPDAGLEEQLRNAVVACPMHAITLGWAPEP